MSCYLLDNSPEEILKNLPKDDVPKLLEVLKRDMPHSTVAYHWIRKQIDWAEKIPDLEVKILCPEGDWRDGTFIGLTRGLVLGGKVVGTLYTMQPSCERLQEALAKSALIPWPDLMHFSAVVERHMRAVCAVISSKGYKVLDLLPCTLHHMSAEEAASLPVPIAPPGVRFGPLDVSHLDIACENWPHFTESVRPMVRAMVEHNITSGVFVSRKNDTTQEDLAAMVLESDYGGIGLLQTVPNFRRAGYASMALTCLLRAMGQAGISPHLHVIIDNHKAMALMQKVGLKPVDQSNWVCLED